jgi:hypothetical protein
MYAGPRVCAATARPLPGTTDVAGPRAYSNWQGQDPGGNTDAFTPQGGIAEASTASKAKGIYFNGGKQHSRTAPQWYNLLQLLLYNLHPPYVARFY